MWEEFAGHGKTPTFVVLCFLYNIEKESDQVGEEVNFPQWFRFVVNSCDISYVR